jgi:hypothetical protein
LKQGVDCLQKLEQCEKVKNSESMRPDNLWKSEDGRKHLMIEKECHFCQRHVTNSKAFRQNPGDFRTNTNVAIFLNINCIIISKNNSMLNLVETKSKSHWISFLSDCHPSPICSPIIQINEIGFRIYSHFSSPITYCSHRIPAIHR